jgi:tripeptidyl-peptidase I
MRLSRFPVLIVSAALAAANAPYNYVVHEHAAESPMDWAKIEKLPKEHQLPVQIGLTQSNLDRGHDLLMDRQVLSQIK